MDISRVNPASMAHLYKTIVLPSILYGCELWNHTNNEDLRRLNTLQHGIIKQILGLPKLTRSDICEQLLDILPISAEIDYRKLLFLGRLCRMNTDYLSKKIFTSRLFSFLYQLTENQTGFIPNVFSLLSYYHLSSYLDTWISTGAFPSKPLWKSVVRTAVYENKTSQRSNRTNSDPDFARFNAILHNSNPYMESCKLSQWNSKLQVHMQAHCVKDLRNTNPMCTMW